VYCANCGTLTDRIFSNRMVARSLSAGIRAKCVKGRSSCVCDVCTATVARFGVDGLVGGCWNGQHSSFEQGSNRN
jgi:hypothetical protein